MCGILAVIGTDLEVALIQSLSKRLKHRGPDESDFVALVDSGVLMHERLSIVDLNAGKQPIQGTSNAWMIHNGEIYNHKSIRENVLAHHTFRTQSDSEVIVHLYEEFGPECCDLLDGIFAFVVLDGTEVFVGRDPLGVKPLYWGKDKMGRLYFASELKAIVDQCPQFEAFPPGHYYTKKTGLVRYYKPQWFDPTAAATALDSEAIRSVLTKAVQKRLMGDVPIGVLLSGGLDSSLIASIASRLTRENSSSPLKSYAVSLDPSAPDAVAAREVAAFLKTDHREIHFTIEEGLQILDKLIWHLETYDVTSIRASTPMFFLSKAIAADGVKVVLSGEGSDEIFGGYMYFRNAPSEAAFHLETIDRLQKLATADLLRADKSTMAHGVEARVPFLDKEFLELSVAVAPEHKMPSTHDGIEKYILRNAFDLPADPYLPEGILWRQKEQFSDGVGYSWIDSLVAYCESQISDSLFSQATTHFPHNTPLTKEAFYYRQRFQKHFPGQAAAQTVLKWIPKWQKNTDPSGRANKAHAKPDLAF